MSPNLWPFRKRTNGKIRLHSEDHAGTPTFTEALFSCCSTQKTKEHVLICIGTDRSTGDAFGPIVGNMLEQKTLQTFHLYGTLAQPIHATNMEEKLQLIYEAHPNAHVIAIDACLGHTENIGFLTLHHGPLKPGAAMGKNLPDVGDICLTGIVNVGGIMDFYMLQSTRLHTVMTMATKLSDIIYAVDTTLTHHFSKKREKNSIHLATNFSPPPSHI
ncbi:spore protease YyaC [Shouchella lonarensis]|uniref:Putative sporulation protein YyaC n=1 Tax=Shouchella lonarensis TaxID=1464122 RepID=A0A1G6NQ64_9BACI|nr:spore protease YyaC [Shouchella lonarensis]SDC69315.1 putative sporulation protein YyaC [Shouchella lonarensis]